MGVRWGRLLGLALSGALLAPAGASAQDCPNSGERIYDAGGTAMPGSVVDDPLFRLQWGLEQINAPEAWARGVRGRGVLVGVIDSGIDYAHPDLRGRFAGGVDLTRPDEVTCGADDYGHGTGVAGVIAATAGNGFGTAGVAPEASVVSLKVGIGSSPKVDVIDDALREAVRRKVRVVNISISSFLGEGYAAVDETSEDSVSDAFQDAYDAGIVIVAAAGNSSLPMCDWPAVLPNIVCVAATDKRGLPSDYSEMPFKGAREGIALRAPGGATAGPDSICGEWIVTAWWHAEPGSCVPDNAVRGHNAVTGTSFAAPHVAGVAALLAAYGLSRDEIIERLRTTSSNKGLYDPVMGYGIVDAAAAVEGLPLPPVPPPPAAAPAPPPAPAPSRACRRASSAERAARRRQDTARTSLRRARSARAKRSARRRYDNARRAHRAATAKRRRACS